MTHRTAAARLPGVVLLLLAGALASPPEAQAQSLSDLVRETAAADTAGSPPLPPWTVVAGEVALGSALAAAAGFGAGLLAEMVCEECDASSPGGDTPGLLSGVPLGALAGVWFIGRFAPPRGRLLDTATGALIGTAVFAGYSELISESGDGLRWAGVVFPAAVAAMGFNRSRLEMRVESARLSPQGPVESSVVVELALFQVEF